MITPQGVFAHEFVRVNLQGLSNNELAASQKLRLKDLVCLSVVKVICPPLSAM